MRLIWAPEDGDKREWSFRPLELRTVDAEDIEAVGGASWESFDEWSQQFLKGNRRSQRAALWILLRREQPGLRFDDLDLRADEIEIEFDEDEVAILREVVMSERTIDPLQREWMLGRLGGEVTAADPLGSASGTSDAGTAGT